MPVAVPLVVAGATYTGASVAIGTAIVGATVSATVATAVGAAVVGTVAGLATGQDVGEALKTGVMSGITAGIGQTVGAVIAPGTPQLAQQIVGGAFTGAAAYSIAGADPLKGAVAGAIGSVTSTTYAPTVGRALGATTDVAAKTIGNAVINAGLSGVQAAVTGGNIEKSMLTGAVAGATMVNAKDITETILGANAVNTITKNTNLSAPDVHNIFANSLVTSVVAGANDQDMFKAFTNSVISSGISSSVANAMETSFRNSFDNPEDLAGILATVRGISNVGVSAALYGDDVKLALEQSMPGIVLSSFQAYEQTKAEREKQQKDRLSAEDQELLNLIQEVAQRQDITDQERSTQLAGLQAPSFIDLIDRQNEKLAGGPQFSTEDNTYTQPVIGTLPDGRQYTYKIVIDLETGDRYYEYSTQIPSQKETELETYVITSSRNKPNFQSLYTKSGVGGDGDFTEDTDIFTPIVIPEKSSSGSRASTLAEREAQLIAFIEQELQQQMREEQLAGLSEAERLAITQGRNERIEQARQLRTEREQAQYEREQEEFEKALEELEDEIAKAKSDEEKAQARQTFTTQQRQRLRETGRLTSGLQAQIDAELGNLLDQYEDAQRRSGRAATQKEGLAAPQQPRDTGRDISDQDVIDLLGLDRGTAGRYGFFGDIGGVAGGTGPGSAVGGDGTVAAGEDTEPGLGEEGVEPGAGEEGIGEEGAVDERTRLRPIVIYDQRTGAPRATAGIPERVTAQAVEGILGEKEPLFGGDEDDQRAVWNRRSLRLRKALGL